jgi:DNA-directed RNA polymerase specialized sigma24 family protein
VRRSVPEALTLTAPGKDGPDYHAAEGYGKLERAIGLLPEDMREVLLLRKVERLSSGEVATHLDKSDAAVRQLASRAMARVAVAMGA